MKQKPMTAEEAIHRMNADGVACFMEDMVWLDDEEVRVRSEGRWVHIGRGHKTMGAGHSYGPFSTPAGQRTFARYVKALQRVDRQCVDCENFARRQGRGRSG